MAATILALCAAGIHIRNIWNVGKQIQTIIFPFNPIVAVREVQLVNASRQVFATQLEIFTKNGNQYFFCFDAQDHALRVAILREFPVGTNINKGTCDYARMKMAESRINHRLYIDTSHPGSKRTFILMSNRPIDLRVFAQSHWIPL